MGRCSYGGDQGGDFREVDQEGDYGKVGDQQGDQDDDQGCDKAGDL